MMTKQGFSCREQPEYPELMAVVSAMQDTFPGIKSSKIFRIDDTREGVDVVVFKGCGLDPLRVVESVNETISEMNVEGGYFGPARLLNYDDESWVMLSIAQGW